MTPASLAGSPRIKICGVTREQDVRAAVECGADYLGLNFYQGSPRYLELERARALRAEVPRNVKVVGVFVNASADEVHRTSETVGLDLVQFHGDETLDRMRPFAARAIRAVRYRPDTGPADLGVYDDFYAVLVDAPSKDAYGGTGESWNWSGVADWCAGRRVFLAGGLRPDNVERALEAVPGAYAVDVCSGVESAPGIKSMDRLAAFRDHIQQGRPDRASEPSGLEVHS